MHYYQFHISDFTQSTKHLSFIEKAIYRELIDLYYSKEKPLENDIKKLARLICFNGCLTTVEQVLNEFFTLVGDHWKHDKCEKIIKVFKKNIKTASKAGKASAAARALKASKLKVSKVVTTVERPLNVPSTNHKPITINHKPITNNNSPAEIPVEKREIPEKINKTAWLEWEAYRDSKKKKISDYAANLQFKLLSKYSIKQQQEIIDSSIANDYQGLFEPRGNGFNDQPDSEIPPSVQRAMDKQRLAGGKS